MLLKGDPYIGPSSRAFPPLSVRYATQPLRVGSTVRPRSINPVNDTPVGVGQNIFVPHLPTDQTRHSTPAGAVNMFSNSTENGKWLDGVRHSSIHSDPRCPVTAGSVVPISAVEAVGLESVQRRQPELKIVCTCMPSGLILHKHGLACRTHMYTLVHLGVIQALPRQGHRLTSGEIVALNPC